MWGTADLKIMFGDTILTQNVGIVCRASPSHTKIPDGCGPAPGPISPPSDPAEPGRWPSRHRRVTGWSNHGSRPLPGFPQDDKGRLRVQRATHDDCLLR